MKTKTKLTAFQPGSFNELIAIALPLIIVSLSENIMIFFDRIILSHYSLISLNAATLASQAVEIFQYGLWAITGMCEIFVAALVAQQALQELAKPCWQMIYLSLFTLPFIIILSHVAGQWILPNAYQAAGLGYYKILIFTVPLIGFIAALAGFFVGQGKIKLIVYSTITINLINLALDFILIFGIKNHLPAMGASGAAISAVISLFIQVIWLFLIFLNRDNRLRFNTAHINFSYAYFKKCISVGLPISASHACEMFAWLLIIKMIATTGIKNFTIISIGSTLYLIYAFINDGLYRSLSMIISHHFAANNLNSVKLTLYKGFGLLFTFLFILAIPAIFFPNSIIHLFNLKHYASVWAHDIKMSLSFIWLYFLLLGMYWVIAALLTAKRRTKFIMAGNVLSIWLATTLPFYLFIHYHRLKSEFIWPLMCAYVFISCLNIIIYYKRTFKQLGLK
jgi:MATE family multidrug resistance protein